MTETKQQNLDRLIREAMEEEIMECPTPRLSATEAWQKMEKKQKEERNPSKKNGFPKKAFLVVAMLFIVLILASYPQKGTAFSRWSELFHKVQGSVVQVFGGSSESLDDQSIASDFHVMDDSGPITEQMDLEEAQKVTNFTINIPIVPSGFQLEQVVVMREKNQKSNEIYLNYVGNEREFIVSEKTLGDSYAFGAAVDNDDTEVEDILINGQQAMLTSFKNGVYTLTWMDQIYYFHIEGQLTKAEIIQIAKSM